MDMADDDPAGQLVDLTRRLRDQLQRHAALGAWAAPGGATARFASSEDGSSEEAELSDRELAEDREQASPAGQVQAIEPRGDELPGVAVVEPRGDELPGVAVVQPPGETRVRRTLPQIRAELGECTRCKLHSTRKSIVFGVGAPDTPLMFVGEAPGEQEDRRGEPFVGAAGQLLDKMIEAMGWTRSAVYIANTTKCRPPGNRNPQPDELEQCMPFLHAQIAAIAPRIIVALGRPASNQLLGTDAPISALRGRFHDYVRLTGERHTCKVMPTFHPAYLLRDPDK